MTTKYLRFSVATLSAFILLSAPPLAKGEVDPGEVLKFFETMTTLDMEKPDINILANLYKARRKAFGFNDVLLRNVEWCVCAGTVAAGRGDLYYKSLKKGCESIDVSAFESQMTQTCPDCKKNGRKTDCGVCGGSGRVWDKAAALDQYDNCALAIMYVLYKSAKAYEATDAPDNMKQGFADARETAKTKFATLRKVLEEEEANARNDNERREQAEHERKKFTFGGLRLGETTNVNRRICPDASLEERPSILGGKNVYEESVLESYYQKKMGRNAPNYGNKFLYRRDAKMEIAGASSEALCFLTRETMTAYSILLAFDASVVDWNVEGFVNHAKADKVYNEVKSALNTKYGHSFREEIGNVWTTEELLVTLYRQTGRQQFDPPRILSEKICIMYTTPPLLRLAQMEEQPFLDRMEAEKRAADEAKKRKEQQSLDSL